MVGETHNKSQKVGSSIVVDIFIFFFNNPPPQKKNVYGIIVRLYLLSLPLFSFWSSLSRRESDIMFSLTLYKSKKGLKSPPLTHSFCMYMSMVFQSRLFSRVRPAIVLCGQKPNAHTTTTTTAHTHTVAVKHVHIKLHSI